MNYKKKVKQVKKTLKSVFKKIKARLKKFFTPKRKYYAILIGATVLLALLTICFIEYRHNLNSFNAVWDMMFNRPRIFFYSAFIILAFSAVMIGLIGDVLVGLAIQSSIFILLMYANYYKIVYRDAPLLPEELNMLSESGSLIEMVGVFDMVIHVVTVLFLFIGSIFLSRYLRRRLKIDTSWINKWKSKLIMQVCLIVAGTLVLTFGTNFIRNAEGRRTHNAFLDTEFVAWNQNENYRRNGFLIGFIYNMSVRQMEEPAGYSHESIERIVRRFQTIAERENELRTSIADKDIDIIYIMNESFFDPTLVMDHHPFTGPELLPNLNRLRLNHPNGMVYTSEFGGGTANIEFEAITGFTNYFTANVVPYTHIVSRSNYFPSFPRFLRENGFRTTAMHPYFGSMYKRHLVFNSFGFDEFIDIRDFKYTDSIREDDRNYISDYSAYRELLDQLNSSDDNQFIFMTTMQNHLPFHHNVEYPQGFESFADVEPHINEHTNHYLESLHLSDKALGFLVDELERLDRNVIVVFWGDHLPYMYDRLPWELRQTVPLLFYANFDWPNEIEIGTMSPPFLNTTLLDMLGVQKPTFYYMLDELKTGYPILSHFYFQNNPPEWSRIFLDYELITFDILSGRRYSRAMEFFE